MPEDPTVREQQEQLHDAIQRTHPMEEGAVLAGWVLVSEWMDGEGEMWFGRLKSSDLADWRSDGLLHYALYGDLDDEDD